MKLNKEMIYHDWCPVTQVLQFDGINMVGAVSAPCIERRVPAEYEVFLRCAGALRYFSVSEITTPTHQSTARKCGYEHFVPPAHCWALSASLIHIANILRAAVGAPVSLRNHWRPQSYNAKVASSGIDSDHPNVAGIDLDFQTSQHREIALTNLGAMILRTPQRQWSVGVGELTIHVGMMSPKGARHWTYDSFSGTLPGQIKDLGR